ncbi:somatostatin receptor type 5-like [Montipora foliosa]|uniref:somatostatin receptor type 5-like n=1 Tax=Montipora foliosa TaxID=591990 RepID=UPI0035F20314
MENNTSNNSVTSSCPVHMDYSSEQSRIHRIAISYTKLVIWCVAFALIAVIVFVGNVLTIAVFRKKKLLRMRANSLLITLAVADLLVGAFAVPLYIHQLVSYWKGNSSYRTGLVAQMVIDIFTGFASIFALTIIALERLYAVLCPLKHRLVSKRTYVFLILIVWLLSGIVAFLYFMNGLEVFKPKVFFYFIIFSIFSSLLVICVSYILIWVNVALQKAGIPRRRKKCNGEVPQTKKKAQDKNLLTTVLILTLVFVLTWIPFYVLNILVFFRPAWNVRIPYEVFFFTKLLHYSNSFANPVVYSIRIPRFTRSLLRSLRQKKNALLVTLRLSRSS